jgi:hypothetical protein
LIYLGHGCHYWGPTGIPGENHWPVGIHWQTLPQNIASSTHYKGQAIKDKGQTMIYKRLTQKLQRNEINENETKRNDTESTKTKRNETKATKWKRNKTKPMKAKRNQRK